MPPTTNTGPPYSAPEYRMRRKNEKKRGSLHKNPLSRLAFDRVLVVVPPHGTYIASGQKRALVKSRQYRMEDQKLLVVEQKKAIAVLRVARPERITLPEFKRRRARHLVSEDERRRWWAGKRLFYFYRISSVRRLPKPVPVDYPQGPQVFVRKARLRYRRIREKPANIEPRAEQRRKSAKSVQRKKRPARLKERRRT